MSMPYLIAYVCNATSLERAEVAFAVASQDEDGDWHSVEGRRYLPFWSCQLHVLIEHENIPPITQDWIDYLHTEAAKNLNPYIEPNRPKLSDLFKPKPITMNRRI